MDLQFMQEPQRFTVHQRKTCVWHFRFQKFFSPTTQVGGEG
jgi:hypothetical protein